MLIVIKAGMKEGKTTVAAAITRALSDHGFEVDIGEDPVQCETEEVSGLIRDPSRLGHQLRSVADGFPEITIVVEQTPRA